MKMQWSGIAAAGITKTAMLNSTEIILPLLFIGILFLAILGVAWTRTYDRSHDKL